MAEWTSANIDNRVCYGKGSARTEDAIDRPQTQYAKHGGVFCTLDFSQAFDRIHPMLTATALAALSFPLGWLTSCNLPEVNNRDSFSGTGTPVLRVFGLRVPRKDARWPPSSWPSVLLLALGPPEVSVYMDNRTMYARTWWAVKHRINSWAAWSRAWASLKTKRKHKFAVGKSWLSTYLFSDIKALGRTSTSLPREESSSERARVAAAVECAALLRSAPLAWHRKTLALQCFVLSKASFGWASRFPTQTSAVKTNRMACKDLRKTLYGAVVTCSTWKRLAKAFDKGHRPEWTAGPHTAVGCLRKALKDFVPGSWHVQWTVPQRWAQLLPRENG